VSELEQSDLAGEVAEVNGDGDPAAISPLDQLKNQYQEVQESRGHTVELNVPGYNDELVATYRLLTTDEVEKLVKRHTKIKSNTQKNLQIAMSILGAACEGIHLRVNGELQSLQEIKELDAPVRFNKTLADILGFDATSSRDVLLAVFPTDWSIIEQYRQLSRWMNDTTKEDFDDFLA
jgi:hypothetical protein